VAGDKMDVVNWQRLAGSWGIRIFTNEGNLLRFAGFKEVVSTFIIQRDQQGGHVDEITLL
jgi:hypothetical protein